MYKCLECSAVFDEPKRAYEKHDEIDGAPLEEFSLCPSCDGGQFEHAAECDSCGEWFPDFDECYTDESGHLFCSMNCALDYHCIRRCAYG